MIAFDGHDLESILIVGDPDITWHSFTPETLDVPGRDGTVVRGVTLGAATVTMRFAVTGTASERRGALSTLGAWLRVDGPRPLVLPDTPDLYYMAVPDGSLEMLRAMGAEISRLTFTITDPAAYGERQSTTVPSGGEVDILVGGTYPSSPSFTGTVTRGANTDYWGLRLDEGDFMHIATGSASPAVVLADCATRECRIDGALTLPSLDSDWFVLEPGPHTIRNDVGTGSVVVTWTERWI